MRIEHSVITTPVAAALLALISCTTALACSFLKTPVSEQIEYVIEGEQKELREPMRPARGAPRVLIFALDGVGRDEFELAVDQGRMPTVAKLLGQKAGPDTYEHAYMARDATTVMPSTTVPAWTSIFTGRPPAETGIPGNEWFDRRTRSYLAPSPVSVNDKEHTIKVFTDGLLDNQIEVPTLFELAKVRSYVGLAPIYAGADLFTKPDLDEVIPVIGAAARGVVGPEQVEREVYAELDEGTADSIVDAIEEHGIADLQVAYFPGADMYTHVAKEPTKSLRKYLGEVVDPAIEEVLDAYRERGALDGTYVVFVSDHGHTLVSNDDRHALGTGEADEPTAVLEETGFRVRRSKIKVAEAEEDYQAVVAYQGAAAYVYLADRSTCPRPGDRCKWEQAPRFEKDVLAVVHAFYENNATGAWVPEMMGALDLVLARRPVTPGQSARPFEVWDGEELVPVDAYVEAHGRDDLIDLDRRLRELAEGPYGDRVGDVMLLTKSGLGRRIEDRYYFSRPYRSWHGSAHEADTMVPLVVAREGMSGQSIRAIVREAAGEELDVLDITPIVLELLGKNTQPVGH
jgi:arylsulfatase A-like enzyme